MTLAIRAPEAWLGPGRLVRDAEIVCDGGDIVSAGARESAQPKTMANGDG